MIRRQVRTLARPVAGLVLGAALLGIAESARAQDWSAWRGPQGTGIIDGVKWNPASLDGEPKVAWEKNVGLGYSAVSISGKYLYTMGNDKKNDTVYCLNGGNGAEVWTYSYPCSPGGYKGPRATPVVDGDFVYTLSREGHLLCLDKRKGGDPIWQKSLTRDADAQGLGWGFSGSPVIAGNMVVVNAGKHGAAFDKKTGKVVWASGSGKGNYSTPVVYRQGGKECAAIFSAEELHGVDLRSGDELWSFPWKTKYDVNAADPIVADGKVFLSSGYGKGCALLDISGGRPRELWGHKQMKNHFSTSVLFEGHLYGIDGNTGRGTLRCLDFNTGEAKWGQDLGFGSLILADRKLIVLNERGQLYVAEAKPDGYTQLASCQAISAKGAKCWTAPVLCKGRLFLRNSSGVLVSLNVSK